MAENNEILTILSVDDDLINTKLLLRMLNRYTNIKEVITAVNGQDALDKLEKREDINLILLDIQMPVMTGMEFLDERANNNEKLANIPVIVLTTDETKKTEALDKGATDFLAKPIREKLLFEKLDIIKELYED